MNLPTIHPREDRVRKAKSEFLRFMIDWDGKHRLTTTEAIGILTGQIETYLKYALRWERHRSTEHPAGTLCSKPKCKCYKEVTR